MPISKLHEHKEIWKRKKILRVVYSEWYRMILNDLKKNCGKTVELGAGSGNFKEFKPDVISADIEKCDWLDMAFDAHFMPFDTKSLSNIVMIDVLHHLSNPIKFLKEAERVLEIGGRLIILEPFPSPVSSVIYKMVHPEPFLTDIDYFNKDHIDDKDPWDANQAAAYLIFFKYFKKFKVLFYNNFKIIKRKKFSCILYPVSGGFENKQLIPDFLIPLFKGIEYLCIPLRFLMAFRCYIVIEKL